MNSDQEMETGKMNSTLKGVIAVVIIIGSIICVANGVDKYWVLGVVAVIATILGLS
jgi:hypothetical protein